MNSGKKCTPHRYTPKRLLKSPVRMQRLMAGLLLCTILVTLLPTGLFSARAEEPGQGLEQNPAVASTATAALESQDPGIPMPEDPNQELDPGMVIDPEVERAGQESAWDVLPPAVFAAPVTGALEELATGLETVAMYKSADGTEDSKDWTSIDNLVFDVEDLESEIPYHFRVRYDFVISETKFTDIAIPGSSYELTLPTGMTWMSNMSCPFAVKIGELPEKITIGTVSVVNGTAFLTFDYPQFKNSDGTFDDAAFSAFALKYLTGEDHLSSIDDCFIEFDCSLSLSALPGGAQFENSIKIGSSTITIWINELDPTKDLPEISKMGEWKNDREQVLWEIMIDPADYKNETRCTVTDTITAEQSYVDGSFTIKIGDDASEPITNNLDITPQDNGETLLTYTFPDKLGRDLISIQYCTALKPTAFTDKYGKLLEEIVLINTATLTSQDPVDGFGEISGEAEPVKIKPLWLDKGGSRTAGSPEMAWTLKINQEGFPLKSVTLTDSLPEGLLFKAGTVTITGETAGVTGKVSVSADKRSLTINWDTLSTAVTVSYTTTLDPNYSFSGTKLTNKAKLVFIYDGTGGSGIQWETKEIGKDVGVISPITKDGTYNVVDHRVKWTIEVNKDKLALTDAILTDTLSQPDRHAYVLKDDGTLDYTVDGLPGSPAVTLEMAEDKHSFTLDFGSALQNQTATVTFYTELQKEEEYAYNNDGSHTVSNIKNEAKLSATVNEQGLETSTNKEVKIPSDVLKKAYDGYDFSSQEMIWRFTVNNDKKPMANAVITDTLPDHLTYVGSSLIVKKGNEVLTGATANADPATGVLTINLNSLADRATLTVTIRTKLDVETFGWQEEGIPKAKIPALKNTAYLNYTNHVQGEAYSKVACSSNEIFSKVIDKSGIQDASESSGYRVNYSILINKLMLDLVKTQGGNPRNFITDTLGEGLQVDLSTLKLERGKINSTGNGLLNEGKETIELIVNSKPAYTYEGSLTGSTLTVPLPEASGGTDASAYLLSYSVDIITDRPNGKLQISNSATLNQISGSTMEQKTEVKIQNASAGGSGDRMASLKLLKVGDNGKPLSGATFALYDQYGTKLNEATTGADGKICFKVNYFKGSVDSSTQFYRIVETAAPDGHDMIEPWKTGVSVTPTKGGAFKWDAALGDKDGDYLKVTNNILRNTIVFTKQNDLGYPLVGATFGLFVGDADKPLCTATSTVTGEVRFSDDTTGKAIPYGDYKLRELTAPENHILNETVYTVSIGKDGLATKIKDSAGNEIAQGGKEIIKNTALKGSITVIKVAEADPSKTLAGAAFTLYDSTGKQIAVSPATGADGKVVFQNLMLGMEYTIEESIAPSGYQLGGAQKVTLAPDPDPAVEGAASIQNVTLTFQNKFTPPPTPTPTPGGGGGGGGDITYPTTSPKPLASASPSPSGSPSPSPSGSPSPSPSGSPSPSPSVSPSPSPSASPSPTPTPTPGGGVNPDTPPVNPVNPPAPPVQPIPAQPVPGGGVQGNITPEDPDYYIDDNGVPRGRGDMPDPVFWIDDEGVPLGYMDEEGEWVEIGPDDIPLGFMGPDGWVEFPPQTGDAAGGWSVAFLLLGTVFVGMTGVLVYQAVGGRKRRDGGD